ncbi:MAG: trypsin-like peptidase domain-containing protein, partial [Ilumatobacteraceae bacterium]
MDIETPTPEGADRIGPAALRPPFAHEAAASLPPPYTLRVAPPAARTHFRLRGVIGIAALVALSAGAGYAGGSLQESTSSTSSVAANAASVAFVGTEIDIAAAVASLQASIVSVNTTVVVRQGPFTQEGEGAGTGVVLDTDGHILTNAHVVADATSVTITLAGETTPRTATVVGSNAALDIAVLRVDDTTGLVPAPIGSSAAMAVGDEVIAIGNALALDGGMTVTKGIVSAVDRTIETESGSLEGLLQTDAAISSGNSGGALVDAAGRVIGINT